MVALPGIMLLIGMVYARPQEFSKDLKEFPFLYLFLGMSLFGMFADIGMGRTKIIPNPLTTIVLVLYACMVMSVAIRSPMDFVSSIITISVSMCLFFIVGYGVQRVPNMVRVTFVVFLLGLWVAVIAGSQGFSGFGCLMRRPGVRDATSIPDGRPCFMGVGPEGEKLDGLAQCYKDGTEGLAYECEKVGWLDTTSIGGGRVRYVGVLKDPNETALATALTIPFAFAFFEQRKTTFRLALLLFTLIAVALEIVFTQSRGGQVALGAVLGVYFIKKYGWKRGIIVAGIMAVPAIVLGGRSGDEASESSHERLGCACAAIKMLLNYPLTGVGYGKFTEYHNLSAHNAYLLAAGEAGLPGIFLFTLLIYACIKVPAMAVQYDFGPGRDADVIRSLSTAMLSAFVGVAIGIFFLSWTYHFVLWINFGLAGAFYSTVRAKYRDFKVKITPKEMGIIFAGVVSFLIVYSGYIKYKGAWE